MSRSLDVYYREQYAGTLEELFARRRYRFSYRADYSGPPVSLTMPTDRSVYEYDHFPPFFDGLLPEGVLLEALLRTKKIDRDDWMSQLAAVGSDLVGAVSVREREKR